MQVEGPGEQLVGAVGGLPDLEGGLLREGQVPEEVDGLRPVDDVPAARGAAGAEPPHAYTRFTNDREPSPTRELSAKAPSTDTGTLRMVSTSASGVAITPLAPRKYQRAASIMKHGGVKSTSAFRRCARSAASTDRGAGGPMRPELAGETPAPQVT